MAIFCGVLDMKILVLLLLLSASLLNARMSWNAPTTLSSLGVDSSRARVAIDQNGNVTAAWIENDFVKSSSLPVNGSWGPATTLSETGASFPRLVVSPSGDATALWLAGGVVTTASLPLNGNWSAPLALSNSGATFPQLSVDASGNLVAAWVRNGNIESVTKLVGKSWPILVDIFLSTQASSPSVAIGDNGTVALVWKGLDQNSISSVYCATKAINGIWGAAQMISTSGQNSGYPRVSVSPSGNVLACFFRWTPDGDDETNVICQVVSQLDNESWTSPRDLSDAGTRIPEDVRVSQDSNGNAIALWTVSYDESTFHLQCATKIGSADWSTPTELLGGNLAPCNLDIFQTPGGDFRIVMLIFSPGTPLNICSTSTNLSSFFAGTWSPFSILSTGEFNANPKVASVVKGKTGYATAVWTHYNGSNLVIQTASGTHTHLDPLSNVTVAQKTIDYEVFSEYQNTVRWQAPSNASSQTGYVIYRDGVQVAQLYNPTCEYTDYNQQQNQTVTYGVAVLDFTTCEQSPTTFVVLPSQSR